MSETRDKELERIQELLREILNYRPNILDGTISCRTCRALVLEENADGHQRWHDQHRTQHSEHYSAIYREPA